MESDLKVNVNDLESKLSLQNYNIGIHWPVTKDNNYCLNKPIKTVQHKLILHSVNPLLG